MKPADNLKYALLQQMSIFSLSQDQIYTLAAEIPSKWEMHGDLVILPQHTLRNKLWNLFGDGLFEIICKVLKVNRIARKNRIKNDTLRSSNIMLLWGNDGWVSHTDNKVKYQWDVTKCMFSIGNITEKLRIAKFDCQEEVVVDLYAGIGYFVLPYLIHAKAKHVHACELNPDSIEALKINLKENHVQDRCTVYFGDNKVVCPKNVADRVNLGLIPSSELSWETACHALRNETGGVMHIHTNVDSYECLPANYPFKYEEWRKWTEYAMSKIRQLLTKVKGNEWTVEFLHLEHVKSYGPHVDHLVLDLNCKPIAAC